MQYILRIQNETISFKINLLTFAFSELICGFALEQMSIQCYFMYRLARETILLTLSKASGVALLGGILILNFFSRKTSNETIENESMYPLEINGVS